MSWAKYSDTAAFHPIALRPLEFDEADDRTVNELFGFVARCTTQAAAHETDYIVDIGTARLIAGMSQFRQLADQAVRAGYMSWVEVVDEGEQPRLALKLVEDENLFHMFLKSEKDAENRRKKDGRDERLTVGARLRDGDQCRYCGNAVRWTQDRRSGRAGTYDHVNGVQADQETSLEEYVVCCGICNRSKSDNAWEPLPPPATPYYTKKSAEFLKERGHEVPVARRVPMRPTTPEQFAASQRRTVEQPSVAAPEDQATVPTGLTSDLDATSREPADEQTRNHGSKPPRQKPAGQTYPVSGSVGSGLGVGRAGSGSAGLGAPAQRAGTEATSDPPARKRRNRRRPRSRAGKDQRHESS